MSSSTQRSYRSPAYALRPARGCRSPQRDTARSSALSDSGRPAPVAATRNRRPPQRTLDPDPHLEGEDLHPLIRSLMALDSRPARSFRAASAASARRRAAISSWSTTLPSMMTTDSRANHRSSCSVSSHVPPRGTLDLPCVRSLDHPGTGPTDSGHACLRTNAPSSGRTHTSRASSNNETYRRITHRRRQRRARSSTSLSTPLKPAGATAHAPSGGRAIRQDQCA